MLLDEVEIKQIDIFAEEALEKIHKRIERYTLGIDREKALRCEETQEIFYKSSISVSPISLYRHMPIAEFSCGFVYLQKTLPKSLTFKELPI